MQYNDNTVATMLLTMALSPDREEYVRPLSPREFYQLIVRIQASGTSGAGKLMNMDISGLMMQFGLSEEEAYRVFVLMNRSVQVTYALERFLDRSIVPVTYLDSEYPSRLKQRMKENAPPFLYVKGNLESLNRPTIGIIALSGVKTSDSARALAVLVGKEASNLGYGLMTGDEPGLSRMAIESAKGAQAPVTAALSGGLGDYALEQADAAAFSLVHPDSPATQAHCTQRDSVLMAICDAVFVLSSNPKNPFVDGISRHYGNAVYAWNGWEDNRSLIDRGATGFQELSVQTLKEWATIWKNAYVEQMSVFEFL